MIRRLLFILLLCSSASATTWYVHPSGNNTTGTSWANAFTSADGADSAMVSGDTVFFGTGIYRDAGYNHPDGGRQGTADSSINGALITLVEGQSATDRTVYACSSFADTNGSGTYHFAKLYGGVNYSTWTQIGSTNKFYHSAVITSGQYLFWSDSVLQEVTTEAALSAGEWWTNGSDSTIVQLWGTATDPDAAGGVETATKHAFYTNGSRHTSVAAKWIDIIGIETKYTNNGVHVEASQGALQYALLDNMKITCNAGEYGNNAACVTINAADGTNRSVRFLNDSIAYGYTFLAGSPPTRSGNANGGGMSLYEPDSMIIESSWFYGTYGGTGAGASAIYIKNSSGISSNVSWIYIRYNTFSGRNGATTFGVRTFEDIDSLWIYGNIFDSVSYAIGSYAGATVGPYRYSNNTFLDCGTNRNVSADGAAAHPQFFKYNIWEWTNSGTGDFSMDTGAYVDNSPTVDTLVDSNMYFINGGFDISLFTLVGKGSPVYTVTFTDTTDWRAEGFDERSTFVVDPYLNETTFAADSATAMSISNTYYPDGWVPTIYGAIQPPTSTSNGVSITGNMTITGSVRIE